MSTRIRKLSPQTKKVKARAEQFTPLLEGQVRKRERGKEGMGEREGEGESLSFLTLTTPP